MFVRCFKDDDAIRNNALFNLMLDGQDGRLSDIRKGDVYPAIRNTTINFYYSGGSLFRYSGGRFRTHFRYAVASRQSELSSYVTEEALAKRGLPVEWVSSFVDGYDDIKQNCSDLSGVERRKVAGVLKAGSPFRSDSTSIIVLDTEVAFTGVCGEVAEGARGGAERERNQIDLLLYNRDKRTLLFCEAKDFSNQELWARQGENPAVAGQVQRYRNLAQERRQELLNAYGEYVTIINRLFNTQLEKPEQLENRVGLVIFGFDSYQRQKIDEYLIDDNSLEGIPHYCRRDPEQMLPRDMLTMWNKLTR